jgi:hypothetical protein
MRWSRIALPPLLVLLGLIGAAWCCRAAADDDRITFDLVTSKWTVAANGTWVVDSEVTVRTPKVNPSHVVRMPMTWSASTEKLDVVQARVDKPDGSSIIEGKEAIREDPLTGDEYFHEYSDEHRMLITFPDVDPGDLIVVRTHRDVFKPRVPGGFTAAIVLDRTVGWEETNYTISVPADMPFHYDTRGFDHQSELIKDRMMHYFHSPKIGIPRQEVAVLGEFDRLPRFVVSTFRDWDEFGKAYASILLPHAKVTPTITATATKLTEGKPDQAQQAQALYQWVRDTIHEVPIPLDQSRPEPNDADQVMAKRYGDDKDHAVLLYALLAARGIPAEFVLLNATNDATIADPPNPRPMNHLILYLPSLGGYVDPTVAVAPFGVLPFAELGKPAIHLGGSGLAQRVIPMPPSGAITARLKTDVTLDADGNVSGTTTTTARGPFGIWLRNAARTFGENDPAAATMLLRQHSTPGTGTLAFDAPSTAGDEYTVRGTFRLANQSALLHGGFFTLWTGLRILPRPGDVLGGPMFLKGLPKREPTFCYPGIESEELSLTLPEGRELGGLPPDTAIDSELVRYRSHWSLNGRRVTVSREFQSLAPGLVCEGQVREDMADVLTKVRSDLLNPVGIRQNELPAPTDNPLMPGSDGLEGR